MVKKKETSIKLVVTQLLQKETQAGVVNCGINKSKIHLNVDFPAGIYFHMELSTEHLRSPQEPTGKKNEELANSSRIPTCLCVYIGKQIVCSTIPK